jgi:peptidoglycan hydrolase-like protein with peptidoglycan-binding domain
MNRTLTAAVALATALGMAGLAHAQSSTSPSTQPSTMAPSTSTTTPSGSQNPAMTGGSYGTQTPQANTQTPGTHQNQATPGQMNAAQNSQSMEPSRADIQQAQEQLKSQGLYRGSVDGVMGPQTQTAIMAFQREQGLPESAQLDQQTMSRLSGGGQSGGMSTSGATGQQPGAARMQPGSATGTQPSAPGTTYGTTPSGTTR